jgi:hypothetical protein
MANSAKAPKSVEVEDFKFTRQPMVRWFDPRQLAGTGVQAFLSSIFGAYADNREVQAALHTPEIRYYTDEDEIWIDYIADLGDGWNSTYTMAKLLAEEERDFVYQGESFPTERGKLLLMGGDQVYPTATREEYRNRMHGPYRSALPSVPPDKEFSADLGLSEDLDKATISNHLRAAFEAEEITLSPQARVSVEQEGSSWLIADGVKTYTIQKEEDTKEEESLKVSVDGHPHLFAIPGNHDWYDGLRAFTRLFCQERWIGGWKTYQSRSLR